MRGGEEQLAADPTKLLLDGQQYYFADQQLELSQASVSTDSLLPGYTIPGVVTPATSEPVFDATAFEFEQTVVLPEGSAPPPQPDMTPGQFDALWNRLFARQAKARTDALAAIEAGRDPLTTLFDR